jgi:RNA recognition motif-containing protein
MTEEQLRDDLSRFGLINQVKIVRDKNIDFVHFLSISTATKVIATLPTEPAWVGKRVNYGKDHCAYVPKSQQAATAAVQVATAQSLVAQSAAASLQSFPHSPFSAYPEMAYYPRWYCNASKHGRRWATAALASTGLCTLVIFTWKPQLRIYVTQLEAAYSKH